MDDPLDDPLDAPDNDLLFNKGPNPYIEPDKCLLCDVRRTYVPTIHCDTVGMFNAILCIVVYCIGK